MTGPRIKPNPPQDDTANITLSLPEIEIYLALRPSTYRRLMAQLIGPRAKEARKTVAELDQMLATHRIRQRDYHRKCVREAALNTPQRQQNRKPAPMPTPQASKPPQDVRHQPAPQP